MVDLRNIQGWVQKAVADIAALEGDKTKIDTQTERNALCKLLAGEGLQQADKDFIQGFMMEKSDSTDAVQAFMPKRENREKPILPTNFAETSLEEYCATIKKAIPEYSGVITQLAKSFVKDGEWDREGFKAFLNNISGNGGIINRAELEYGIIERFYKE